MRIYIFLFSCLFVQMSLAKSQSLSGEYIDKKKSDSSLLLIPQIKGKPKMTTALGLFHPDGRLYREWPKLEDYVHSAILDLSGNLVILTSGSNPKPLKVPYGIGKRLLVLDKKSKIIFSYQDDYMHHDVEPLENGHFLIVRWYELPKEFVLQMPDGKAKLASGEKYWADEIAELDRSGKITTVWRYTDSFGPKDFVIKDDHFPSEISHANSIKYLKEDPLTGQPAILVSMRTISKIVLIRLKDKKILWVCPEGVCNLQHDATLTENGNILFFDNGNFLSRIIEVDPRTDQIRYLRLGGLELQSAMQFHSLFAGSVQKLENGNYFLTDGLRGFMSEYSPDKKKVWQMFGPKSDNEFNVWPYQALFKVRRYSLREIKRMGL